MFETSHPKTKQGLWTGILQAFQMDFSNDIRFFRGISGVKPTIPLVKSQIRLRLSNWDVTLLFMENSIRRNQLEW